MRQIWEQEALDQHSPYGQRPTQTIFPGPGLPQNCAEVIGIWVDTLMLFLPCYSQKQKHPTQGPHGGNTQSPGPLSRAELLYTFPSHPPHSYTLWSTPKASVSPSTLSLCTVSDSLAQPSLAPTTGQVSISGGFLSGPCQAYRPPAFPDSAASTWAWRPLGTQLQSTYPPTGMVIGLPGGCGLLKWPLMMIARDSSETDQLASGVLTPKRDLGEDIINPSFHSSLL